MRFISGLKNLSKKRILFIIVILFVVSWFLFAFGFDVFLNITFTRYFLIFLGILAGFTFILFCTSFFIPIDKMGIFIIVVAAVLTLPVMWVFGGIIRLFTVFCYIANIIITAFFAFKFCMDTSIKVDDYLCDKKSSRIFTRIIEFVIFFLLCWWFASLSIRFFVSFPTLDVQNLARLIFNIFLIGLVLLVIVLIKLIFTKKFAAYISFFNLLTFFYVLYIIIDLWAAFIFADSSGYDLLSFFIDFLLFMYIIGSIYERVEYIKEKLKIFRADTIALFIILMKLIVQIIEILRELFPPTDIKPGLILEAQILWIFFIIITLIVGIYTIFTHIEGKSISK